MAVELSRDPVSILTDKTNSHNDTSTRDGKIGQVRFGIRGSYIGAYYIKTGAVYASTCM